MKTVLVSGASVGYGAEIAKRFLIAGHQVIALARRGDRLAVLKTFGEDRLLPVVLDLTDTAAIAALPSELPEQFRQVDIIINNAGSALGLEPAHEASLKDWDDMIDLNVRGLVHLTRAFLPGIVERNSGHILNISSTAAVYPYLGGNVYGATKAFVRQFSRNLRADLYGTKIRVTVLLPGLTGGTEFSKVRFHGDEDKAAKPYIGVEALTVNDIADTVQWVIERPEHVNINEIEIMPVAQSFGALSVHRSAQ